MAGELINGRGPYLTEAEYEAMSIEELTERFSDLDMRFILQDRFGLDSVIYFMGKVEKLRYISQPDQRPDVLAAGAAKRAVHSEANRENRARPAKTVQERLLEETKDRQYRQVSITRAPGTQDQFTGRTIRDVYTIEDVADGQRFQVSRGTARLLESWGRLEDFSVTRGRVSVAHGAGEKSLADYFAEPGEQPKVPAPKSAPVAEPEVPKTMGDSELEDLLNSLA